MGLRLNWIRRWYDCGRWLGNRSETAFIDCKKTCCDDAQMPRNDLHHATVAVRSQATDLLGEVTHSSHFLSRCCGRGLL